MTGFWARARTWFAAHGIDRITRLITDNGPCYKSHAFNRSIAAHVATHQYTRPYTSDTQRSAAIAVWNNHYNYHRPHSACATNHQPAAPQHASQRS